MVVWLFGLDCKAEAFQEQIRPQHVVADVLWRELITSLLLEHLETRATGEVRSVSELTPIA